MGVFKEEGRGGRIHKGRGGEGRGGRIHKGRRIHKRRGGEGGSIREGGFIREGEGREDP